MALPPEPPAAEFEPTAEANGGAEPDGARRAVKSAGAFRTISEVADDLAVPQHVLRFWESKFSQVRPLKRGGGRRYYRPEDVELLRRVARLLYQEGYTIKGVQRLLREGETKSARPAASVTPALPLGLDPPEAEPDQAELVPLDAPEAEAPPEPRRAAKPALPEPITDPAARALLRSILEELEDLRDLLPRRDR
jgi:DNA-binding transcriptional MerR regulator